MALRTLRIFISSPGDVAEERIIARRVIGRLDSQFGDLVHLEAVFWEYTPLLATASFQEQLLRPSDTDIAIVILWSRLGTALPAHIRREDGSVFASGTEFEFEDAVAGFERCGKPRVLTYRKTAATVPPGDLEALEDSLRQKQAMERFVQKWFRNEADGSLKAAFHNFSSPAEFEDLLEAHLTRLVESHLPAGAAVRGGAPTWRDSSPFRGLEVFEPEHAPVFFGRTAAAASVLSKLRTQAQAQKAFVLIVSMSGGGKSSLVRAGVLPLMLQPGVVGAATMWRHAVMRPSDGRGNPVRALERVLLQATAPAACDHDGSDCVEPVLEASHPAELAQRICDRLDAISEETHDGRPAGASECHLALVVDQLEEMFSDDRIERSERDFFFAAVDALARSGKVWVIATLRSDAYPRISESPLLMALKEGEGQFDLLPPSLREIGQIIRLPAAAAGLRFEVRPSTAERLDDVIRDAAARNPGALPLLQFLLEELYKRRNQEDVLTFRAYEELGGVEGALAQRAETVLSSVSPPAQKALPAVLRELVTFGNDDDSQPLRRVAPRRAFESQAARELVDALVKARLLVSTLDEDGESAISLAHEALLEFWPRLRSWRDEDRELLLIHARIAVAARAWEKDARSADLLLGKGKPLAEAKALTSAGVRLTASESALLAASERRARRFSQLRAGAITGLALLAAVAAFSAYKATLASGRAQVQAVTAQRTTDFMVSLFSVADPDENQGEKVTVREILDRGVTQINTQLKDEDSVRANLLRAMGQAYNGLGLYPKARDVLTEAVARSERSGIPADLLKARMALAENRYQDGDYDQAEALYRLALAQAKKIYGSENAAVAQAMTGLGEALADKNASQEAESLYRGALAMNLKLHGEQSADTARTMDGLARLIALAGRYDEAAPLYQRSLNINKSLYGPVHSNVASSLNNLGSLYFQVGQYDRAIAAWGDALPVYRSVFGNEHQYVAATLNNLGRVELLSGKLDTAQAHLAEALAIDRKVLAAGHPDLVLPLNSLAMVMMARSELKEAQALLDEALAISRPRNHWMLNQVLGNEAELAFMSARYPEGRMLVDEARAVLQKQYGDKLKSTEAWRSAVLDVTEAAYELQQHDSAQAERLLLGALPILEQHFGKRSFYVERANARLVSLYTQSGQSNRANEFRARLSTTGH